jgi:hypothetical protein
MTWPGTTARLLLTLAWPVSETPLLLVMVAPGAMASLLLTLLPGPKLLFVKVARFW